MRSIAGYLDEVKLAGEANNFSKKVYDAIISNINLK
jgi:hypothetical protein